MSYYVSNSVFIQLKNVGAELGGAWRWQLDSLSPMHRGSFHRQLPTVANILPHWVFLQPPKPMADMSHKKHNLLGPRKLTEFFCGSRPWDSQDGASSRMTAAPRASQRASSPSAGDPMDCTAPHGEHTRNSSKWAASSPFASPSHAAPVSKNHFAFHHPDDDDDDSGDEQAASLANLFTTNNPVAENTVKQMLLSV